MPCEGRQIIQLLPVLTTASRTKGEPCSSIREKISGYLHLPRLRKLAEEKFPRQKTCACLEAFRTSRQVPWREPQTDVGMVDLPNA